MAIDYYVFLFYQHTHWHRRRVWECVARFQQFFASIYLKSFKTFATICNFWMLNMEQLETFIQNNVYVKLRYGFKKQLPSTKSVTSAQSAKCSFCWETSTCEL